MTANLLPQTMQAVICNGAGGPEVLELGVVPCPRPAPGEVVLRVQAAGINRPDVMQREGRYPPPPGASPLLGLEVAGEIIAINPADAATSRFTVGDKVCALSNGGGYAQYCAVPVGQCLPWPKNFTAVQAAALPETLFTVWSNLFMTGKAKAGETVLVHGGAGGIGTMAIQVLASQGLTSFATAGSDEKCKLCKDLGAEAAINYRTEDFVERVSALTDKKGVDLVLDMIGASYFSRNIECLGTDGRLILIALQSGAKANDVPLVKFLTRRISVTGSALRPRPPAYKAEIATQVYERVWPHLENGNIKPLIDATYPIAKIQEAHRHMDSGTHAGKIILEFE